MFEKLYFFQVLGEILICLKLLEVTGSCFHVSTSEVAGLCHTPRTEI